MAVDMMVEQRKQSHNKVDPQGPTKTDQPAPVFFPALLQHGRVSHSNHLHLNLIPVPFYPQFPHLHPWPSFYQMARPRKSEQRDRKVQPPRPPNAWILYRSYQFNQLRDANGRLSQANVSKIVAEMWKNEGDDVKRYWEKEAETKKAQHQELYPDYRYCPQRKEIKQRRKKTKTRDATPSDVDDDVDGDNNGTSPPAMPAFIPIPYVHQPQPQFPRSLVPGYHPSAVMPQHFTIPYLPEAHYGPGGPSPPLSAAPSPVPHVGSDSPRPPQSVASSSSTPSARLSPSLGSRASSSSLQLPANSTYPSSLPNSHHPSPGPYTVLQHSTLLFQNPMPAELPLTSPRLQLRSTENTVSPEMPDWNSVSSYLSSTDPQNSEHAVNLTQTINQAQALSGFNLDVSSESSFDALQALLSSTDQSGVFDISNIESSALLNYPQGDLEVAMGPSTSSIDYCEDLFADFDVVEFQRQIDSLEESGSTSPLFTSRPLPEDIQSLFHTPNNPELQGYMIAQQRQPSAFTQEMMNFLNFEATEDSTEDPASATPPPPLPAPTTTVAPQQVRVQNPQGAPAMPIFTQMTNVPTIASGNAYVPPAGAIYSSTRRVAGTWKPSFTISSSQIDESMASWDI